MSTTLALARAALTQAWWAPLAALLLVYDLLVGIAIPADQQNPGSLVGGALFLSGAATIAVGLLVRPSNRRVGNWLILYGSFWGLPIFWTVIPPLLTIAVWVGVLGPGRSAAPPARSV